MPSKVDLERGAETVRRLQDELERQGDDTHQDKLHALLSLLESPVFSQILQLQSNVKKLKKKISDDDFDPQNINLMNPSENEESSSSSSSSDSDDDSISDFTTIEEFIAKAAQGRETEMIELYKAEKEGLGFSVVGLRSENRGDLGIFVQDIKPGGVADRQGGLKERDQILVIDGQAVAPNISHQEAIGILQQVKGTVKLVVARGGIPQAQGALSSVSPQVSRTPSAVSSLSQTSGNLPDTKWAEVETIELHNDGCGLGFGIVGGQATGGVVVKTIVDGGAAQKNGRLRSGDHILRIGDTDVREMSSEQAAQILRQCGTIVKLIVARGALDDIADRNDFVESTKEGDADEGHSSESEVESKTTADTLQDGDMNYFDVVIEKDSKGLGITIAGFVDSEYDETDDESSTSKIYIKSVLPGSAASKDGRIRPRDQIVAVDGRSLLDPHITSDDAVNVLRSTGQVVKLTISRPRKPQDMTTTDMQSESSSSSSSDTEVVESHQEEEEDDEEHPISYELPLSEDMEQRIEQEWSHRVGTEYEIVVAQINKFSESSGLGISLEGTVDMSDHPHHYVRSILHDGPVGINGTLRPGDELLEVNGHPLLGLHHFEVVVVMKELPIGVVMVCARPLDALFKAQARDSVVLEEFDGEFHRVPESDIAEETEGQTSQTQTSSSEDEDDAPTATDDHSTDEEFAATSEDVHETSVKETSMSEAAITSMSEAVTSEASTSSTEEVEDEDTETEEITKDAAWGDEIHYVELNKSEKGLGFSILDFQDPVYPDKTALLIRSLVQGGESDTSGQINPGDKLVSVNQVSLEGSNLETAVTVLKALPRGIVMLGLKKPKSMYQVEAAHKLEEDEQASSTSSEEEVNESHHIHEPSPAPSPHVSRTFNVEPTVSSSSSEDDELGDSSTTVPSVSSVIAAFNKGQQPATPQLTRQSPTEELSTTGSASVSEASTSDVSSHPPVQEARLEPRIEPSSTTDRKMEVKHIPVAGMTAIAITSSNIRTQPRQPSPLPQQQQQRVSSPTVTAAPPTMIPTRQSLSPRQKNSAPSWQDSGLVHAKPFPEEGYERIVHIEKGNTSLGVTVSPDKDGDGLVIRSILTGGAISRTGEPQVGDIIRRVNSDSAVGLGAMQARSLIRNHSMHSSKVKIVYIPKANIHAYKNGLPPVEDITLRKQSSGASDHESIASIKSKFEHKDEKPVQPSYQAKPRPVQAAAKRSSPVPDPEPNHNLWAPAKRIEIGRSSGMSLGISIVGGVNKNKSGSKPQDIYIKDVIPTSTVGMDGRIKSGDRILKVDNTDLIGATHADAVEAIRNSGNPVVLWVQSYLGEAPQSRQSPAPESVVGRTPAEIEETYRGYPGQLHIIDLFKGPKGLGLSLAGNKESPNQGIFVVGVNPDGAAGKDGRIQVGDEIREINAVPLNAPNNHQTAISVISSAKSKLQIVIIRPEREPTPEPVQPQIQPSQPDVRVIKLLKDFQGLGFAIKETTSGIVVQSIASGGTADRDGELKKGDYIIAVNQHTLKDVSYEMAINILKSTKGVVSLTVASSPKAPSSAQEEDALTRAIVDGEEVTIEIMKGKSGLGLSIVGGSDSLLNSILVHTVYDNGAAAKDGRLWPGDQILSVNNKDLHNATHEEAIEALRHTPSRVRLTVLRDTNRSEKYKRDSIGISDSKVEYFDVVLHKPPGRGLGLSIVGKRDGVGVFISDVVAGGAAHAEGRLRKGDQIVGVDDFSIENANQKEAAEVLKNIGETVKLKIARANVSSGGAVTSLLSPSATLERSSKPSSVKSDGGKNIRFVEIEKTPTHPLGISISGGIGSPLGDVPVFVAMVQNHGAAKGKLNVGDKILSINGQATDYKSHEEIVNMLRGTDDAIVLMKVQEGDEEIMKLSNFLAETASAMNAIVESNNKEDAENLSRQASLNESVDLSKCVDVTLYRGESGLGFSIVGGIGSTYGDLPIFVKSISPGGAAEESVLKKGDQIIAVNGEHLTSATHEEALDVLKNALGRIVIRIIPS